MRAVAALCLVIGLAVPALGRAQEDKPAEFPEKLEIGISTDEIAISSDFRGADLTIFGAIEGYDPALLAQSKYDIVVALEGPKDNNTVRVKERVASGVSVRMVDSAAASTRESWPGSARIT